MKKFLLRTGLFFFILSVFVLTIHFIKTKKESSTDYMAAIIDKHNLLVNTKSPRIILAGGSNLTFGINSQMLEKELKIPVINLSLHAGLGLEFILNELKQSILPGDLVFLSIEYYLPVDGQYGIKKNAAKYYPEAFNYFSSSPIKDIGLYLDKNLTSVKNFVFNKEPKKSKVYSRSAFNSYGDMIGHLDLPVPKKLKDNRTMQNSEYKGISSLNAFCNHAKKVNVSVFFLFPNYPYSAYIKNKEAIKRYEKDMETMLNCKILNKPEDMVFADTLFYDTVYHLNKAGRELRTKKMVSLIRPVLGNR